MYTGIHIADVLADTNDNEDASEFVHFFRLIKIPHDPDISKTLRRGKSIFSTLRVSF